MESASFYADLPQMMPDMAQYSNLSNDGKYFAIYTFHSFSVTELGDILNTASDAPISCQPPTAALSPSHDCAGIPLRAALDRHATLAKDQQQQSKQESTTGLHPYIILAVIKKNWNDEGILAVNMNANYDGTIDYLLLPAQGCGTALANITVGNSSWEETKHDVAQTMKQKGIPDTSEREIAEDLKHLKVDDQEGDETAASSSRLTGERIAVYKSRNNNDMVSVLGALNGADFRDVPAEKWHYRDTPWVNHVLITVSGSGSLTDAEIGVETDKLKKLMEEHKRYLGMEEYAGLGFRSDRCLLVPADGAEAKRVLLLSRVEGDAAVRAKAVGWEEMRMIT
jgi:hypothetical protein